MQQFGAKCIDHIALCEIHISGKRRIRCECDLSEYTALPFWEGKKLVRPANRTLNMHKIW